MIVEIEKRPDGTGVLRCTREDGSVTWQRQTKHASFFALHDLTHFAVESVLGCGSGFFGLIAQGWEMEDTDGKGRRGPLPEEAADVERIVGLFDSERASGGLWTAEEFTAASPSSLSEAELQRIRVLRADLFRKWAATLPGEKLQLRFASNA